MASIVKSRENRDFLKVDTFLFRKDCSNAKKTKQYWRCLVSSCKTKVHTKFGTTEIINRAGVHTGNVS